MGEEGSWGPKPRVSWAGCWDLEAKSSIGAHRSNPSFIGESWHRSHMKIDLEPCSFVHERFEEFQVFYLAGLGD